MSPTTKERAAVSLPGIPVLLLLLAATGFAFYRLILGARAVVPLEIVLSAVTIVAALLLLVGLFMVEPNQARVLTLFGAYRGSERRTGLRWANPFYSKKSISLRVRNFETERLKVNDLDGNPIEIAAVVVWRVVDSFEAVFHVDNYEDFVHVQSESALRNLATHFSYDAHTEEAKSLRGSTAEIAEQLRHEIRDRLEQAGVDVLEARITHLAYAPEIAHAMLQRQQASAIIAARTRIVDGAVGMVEMALAHLEAKNIVHLDPERRATMVSNLLVVLCSDRSATPVVNAGTLY
jgi:regulator of protease activity HflC (stomatin/prohibitin superfamily)